MNRALRVEQQRALVERARRAPSAHNTQPARWRFDPEGWLELHADPDRALPVADASGHDLQIAMGAAWEGMQLALSEHGLRAEGFERRSGTSAWVARGRPTPGGAPDPLAVAVERRTTWRGRFPAATTDQRERLLQAVRPAPGATTPPQMIEDAATVRWLVERADRAGLQALRSREHFVELVEWLRLSPRHPGWSRDGLSAEALRLSGFERLAAACIAQPSAHGLLKATGWLAMLADEAPRARTASAVALLLAPREEEPFAIGRAFYRLWLAIAAADWSLCPMSALADDTSANAEVRARCGVPESLRIVNVLRLGPTPREARGRLAARLPVDELILPAE